MQQLPEEICDGNDDTGFITIRTQPLYKVTGEGNDYFGVMTAEDDKQMSTLVNDMLAKLRKAGCKEVKMTTYGSNRQVLGSYTAHKEPAPGKENVDPALKKHEKDCNWEL